MASGLSLIRLALLQLRPAPRGGNTFGAAVQDVRVETVGSGEIDGGLELILSAEIELAHKPKRTAAGRGNTWPRANDILDEFGVYPTDLRNVRRLPADFWCPAVTPRTIDRSFEAITPGPG